MSVRLRPHHVLCAIGFDGQGYNAAYAANISRIVDGTLRKPGGASVTIHVTGNADSICAPCPFRRGAGCETQSLIDALDARHGAALGLAPGDRLSWGACLDLVRRRVRAEDLSALCAGCNWLEAGPCRSAITRLTAKAKGPPEGGPETVA
ncbi:DUF1284 domain-containing protein [Jannaschia formosa]|uniref:DUF1284 domain-containing protein n=1 Tax=Jannaschia formosa TaxID=2259592 RepID=UPI000E1B6995|nr:DUF1284 domain-containing protein [Jannaschia formosa]TFL18568.1 DUF1284 domain-containing protein [Jannaschia formosa]